MAQAVRDLQELHAAAATEPWGYEWLAPPAVAALVHLVAACMLRPSGKVPQALAHLEAGQQLIAESLQHLGVRLKVRMSAGLVIHPSPGPSSGCFHHIRRVGRRQAVLLGVEMAHLVAWTGFMASCSTIQADLMFCNPVAVPGNV